MKGLYIHIPFCQYVCHYCDFVKQVPKNDEVIDTYIHHLIAELSTYHAHFSTIDTIYIGGGTPSFLTIEQIKPLLTYIKNHLHVSEYTIEINPDSYDDEKGRFYHEMGIQRASVGVQTFNETLLHSLNRKHTNEDVFRTLSSLRTAGFNAISVDLIYALPNQTFEDLVQDLKIIKTLDIDHISCYTLILEEKTYLYHLYLKGLLKRPNEDLEATMYEYVTKTLKSFGFEHYEISNYAKKNKRSRHNMLYWQQEPFIGIGMGAFGFIDGYRTYNERGYYPYLKKPLKEKVLETPAESLANALIFGLRKIEGIDLLEINSTYQVDIMTLFPDIQVKIEEGLLALNNNRLFLTDRGLLLGNEVFRIFV